MAKKLKVDELMRLAFIHAESDREYYADCNHEGSVERAEALDLAAQLGAYRRKRWGNTKIETAIKNSVLVDAFTGLPVNQFPNPKDQP